MNEMKWKETTLKKISYIMLKCIHIKLPFFSIINNKWDIQGIQVSMHSGMHSETLCIPYTTKSLFFKHNLFIEIAWIKEIYYIFFHNAWIIFENLYKKLN